MLSFDAQAKNFDCLQLKSAGNGLSGKVKTDLADGNDCAGDGASCGDLQAKRDKYTQKDSNTFQITRRKVPIDLKVGAESGAVGQFDSELASIVAAWPRLSEPIRHAVRLLVHSESTNTD